MNNIGDENNMNNSNQNNRNNFRNILENNFLNDIYESFVNEIISIPLTSQRNYSQQQRNRPNYNNNYNNEQHSNFYNRYNNDINNDINSAMRLNSRIIYNIYNIRRQLELQNPTRYETFYPPTNYYNAQYTRMRDVGLTEYGHRQRTRGINSNERERERRYRRIIERDNNRDNVDIEFLLGNNNFLPNMRILNDNFIDNIQNIFDNIIDQYTQAQTFEDVKITLTNEQFLKLNDKILNNDVLLKEYENKDCNICIETYKKDDQIIILPCNHIFHYDCIKNWLCNEKVTCPICRTDVREYINKQPNAENNDTTIDTNIEINDID